MKSEWFKIRLYYTPLNTTQELIFPIIYKWRDGDNTSDLIFSAKETFYEQFPYEKITSIKSDIIKKSF